MKFLQILTILFCLSVFITAQNTNLSGKVYDQAGAAVSETKISLTDKDGKETEAFADNDGFYQINVLPGTYLLEAEYTKHQAWEKFRIENYEIPSSVKVSLDITLRVSEEFTKKYGTSLTAEPIKENKTKRKNIKRKINK